MFETLNKYLTASLPSSPTFVGFLFAGRSVVFCMADRVSEQKRSWIMSRIRSKDTKPELVVRKFLYKNGFRYVLYNKRLPGKPDLSNSKREIAIFVHGCFWHHHGKCKRGKWPKSNQDYWIPKIKRNTKKDRINKKQLEDMGWTVFTIWECETNKNDCLNDLFNGIKKAAGLAKYPSFC